MEKIQRLYEDLAIIRKSSMKGSENDKTVNLREFLLKLQVLPINFIFRNTKSLVMPTVRSRKKFLNFYYICFHTYIVMMCTI